MSSAEWKRKRVKEGVCSSQLGKLPIGYIFPYIYLELCANPKKNRTKERKLVFAAGPSIMWF